MAVKRKIEITIEKRRRVVVVSASMDEEEVLCRFCETGELLVSAENAARIFAVSRRRVYQSIETGKIHFIETGAGVLLVCPNSPAENFGQEKGLLS